MVNSVFPYCWTLCLIQLATGLVHGNVRLDDSHPGLRLTDDSFLSDIGKGSLSRGDPVGFRLESEDEEEKEEELLMDLETYDEDVAEVMQLQSRAMRSPRRCIPHQQSCLGNTLPCCDPCDTRYPRMFGSICYCRRTACAGAHRRP
ncbi:agouti-related protein-like [Oncorhynchus mykiss]|uniref:Agouti domain-containing protein n=1 Tax=Oncorhynchus mykiss TaxID=8022 RepID=A0A8K9WMF7_ONCMY|nr:agouti-related protein-like [Oncorhynchus mykiss]